MRMSESSARVYRAIFAIAALYNIAFGLWAAILPHAFFDLFALQPPRYPAIWACLGMVVGLYGAGYAYAAWRIDRAAPFIAIGLAGKVLGPIGWIIAVRSHELPFRTFPLIVFDDLLWWLPFALFLIEPATFFKRLAPYWCAAAHVIASIAILTIAPRIAWLTWMIAAQTLVGFYVWWGSRVAPPFAIAALLIAIAGVFCDYSGESLFITATRHERLASLLTGGAANALYTLAGVTLTIAWGSARPSWLKMLAWLVWSSGVMLTIVTIIDSRTGVIVSSAALMIFFVPFVVAMGATSR